jgi:hypothetical protein
MADKVLAIRAQEEEHVIKPQASKPATDTSDWPLLLKNYDKRANHPPDTFLSSYKTCN